jgi:predicted nucleic acid-binding protein
MATLADTNILLRSLNTDDPYSRAVNRALSILRLRNESLVIAPQNLIEFWAVATRSTKENGLGLTTAEAGECSTGFQESKPMTPIWLP